jgi:alpha-ribazole phosphatase/probable phosphoglycerate mutase
MILFVRHAKTKLNKLNLIQTVVDEDIEDLNETEKASFKSLLEYSAINNGIDIQELSVICSNSKRTQQTAKSVGWQEFDVDERINELNLLKFDKTNKDDLVNNDEFTDDWDNFREIEGTENKADFINRISNFLDSLDDNKNYLVFSHGLVIRGIISLLVYNDINFNNILSKINVQNLDITVINAKQFKGIYHIN